jgi:hypothetical protein
MEPRNKNSMSQDELYVLLDKEADDAAAQLEQLLKSKSFSIIASLREIIPSPPHFSERTKLSGETYTDLEIAPIPDGNGQFIEMKSSKSVVSRGDRERIVTDEDVDSPLARASE